MKKTLTAILGLACSLVMSAGFAACEPTTPTAITYTLNSEGFNRTVVYDATFDYSDFVIEGSNGEKISVTGNMVLGWDTSSVGEKSLVVTYKDMTVTIPYTVKYEVKLAVDNQTISTQYVLDADEIEIPDGYVFDIPAELTGNLRLTGEVEDTTSTDVEIVIADTANELPVGASGVTLAVTVTGAKNWTADVSNDNLTVRKMSGLVLIQANKVGVTELTISAGKETATKTIVIKPASLTINESANTYGIEDVYTLARTDVNGVVTKKALSVSCAKMGEGFAENVVWTSNNENVTIENGEITLAPTEGAQMVTFTAEFFGVSTDFQVRCVFDGVNVNSYADLYAATKAQKPIVLGGDIAFPTSATEIKYETVHTTYDDTYYKNIGKQSEATIKILLQFKNDLYGNGYEINAHNATVGLLDASGNPTNDTIFKGPLDFVSLTQSGASAASVKGQDNVCFGVYQGVTLNNVVLKGANLNNDLTELNYAGTTVEVFGDDVTLEYSRIMNGRTVLRVFGDAADASKVIHVEVKNSVLSGAREFILRMGSNAFVDATDENDGTSPYLDDQEFNLIGMKKGQVQKPADYEEKYIKTFVNVQNSVFKDAGIFAVGIDAHFAGLALHDASSYERLFDGFKNWHGLSKASYGAKLTFSGEVKMYNWKKVDEIDSSTIIEINKAVLSQHQSIIDMLTLDVSAMLEQAASSFPTVVTNDGYAHAGIIFFGGGRNYGLFEDNANMRLEGFEVSFSDMGKDSLATAAGIENFYFRIYDNTTSTFTPDMQNNMDEEDMYACIYRK